MGSEAHWLRNCLGQALWVLGSNNAQLARKGLERPGSEGRRAIGRGGRWINGG